MCPENRGQPTSAFFEPLFKSELVGEGQMDCDLGWRPGSRARSGEANP
jgi:hypothetical protein